jgi:glutamyl-tRNA synthetase
LTAPRVRFAPSPTGLFHVGSARSSLFNWLYARQHCGTFVLRIEDTDIQRNREEWVHGILSAMRWLGMEPDEGPFLQSERAERHLVAAEALWDAGFLYACDCSREDVESRTKGNRTPGYDRHCRERRLERGPGRALRFRTPDHGTVVVSDLIRGEVSFPLEAMEDFVVVKSSGHPLFVLANVVDDRDMEITHVIRGEEHLPNTPKAVLLWRALDESADGEAGWGQATAVPVFAHLPLLVNEKRQKLSKRKDPVAVELYRDQGYLPEAFRNYLALLGWSPPGDAEKVDLPTLVAEFRLEAVHHAPAFFDVQKLAHLNGEYVRELSSSEFVTRCRPWVAPTAGEWAPAQPPPWPAERFDEEAFAALAPLVQERVATLGEVPAMVDFVFLADPVIDEASWQKAVAGDEGAPGILSAASAAYATCPWDAATLHDVTRQLGEDAGRKLGKAQAPIRVAVTGRTVGPPLFESLVVLGRPEVRRRIAAALDRLTGADAGAGATG